LFGSAVSPVSLLISRNTVQISFTLVIAALFVQTFSTANSSEFGLWAIFGESTFINRLAFAGDGSFDCFARSEFKITDCLLTSIFEFLGNSPSNAIKIFVTRFDTFVALFEGKDTSLLIITGVNSTFLVVVTFILDASVNAREFIGSFLSDTFSRITSILWFADQFTFEFDRFALWVRICL